MNALGTIFLIVVGLLELGFAVYLFKRYEKSRAITYFGLFTLGVSGWVLTNGISMLSSAPFFDFLGRMAFVFAAFLFPLLYLFLLEFPYPKTQTHGRFILSLLIAPTLLSAMVLGGDALVVGFGDEPFQPTIYGDHFIYYSVYMLFMFGLVLAECIRRMRTLEGYHRWQIKMIFVAALCSGLIGLGFNLVLPSMFDIRVAYWFGPGSSIIWLGFVWYIAWRRV